ncbi:hypothetical protein NDU88_002209 [Pleurodeles waltl]|uniref:Uncharacterized protein n=1 Tax=Pleurodeles waltl TaxID=8319 RepID=A0AAV7T242_PLEWA|nr:hypothetical protein NDU88_002209 [Pleurodeles waltl]
MKALETAADPVDEGSEKEYVKDFAKKDDLTGRKGRRRHTERNEDEEDREDAKRNEDKQVEEEAESKEDGEEEEDVERSNDREEPREKARAKGDTAPEAPEAETDREQCREEPTSRRPRHVPGVTWLHKNLRSCQACGSSEESTGVLLLPSLKCAHCRIPVSLNNQVFH